MGGLFGEEEYWEFVIFNKLGSYILLILLSNKFKT
jgi:hypothetical protein